MDSEILRNSIISIRNKTLPAPPTKTFVSNEPGDIIGLHDAYEFFGLNFKDRTGRENMEVAKKIKTILDYAKENSDDVIGFLQKLEGKLGAKQIDVSLLDHIYHAVKFRNVAEESAPIAERKSNYAARAKEAATLAESLREQMKTAKETAKLAQQLSKIEERKQLFEKKLSKIDGQLQTSPSV